MPVRTYLEGLGLIVVGILMVIFGKGLLEQAGQAMIGVGVGYFSGNVMGAHRADEKAS